MTRGARSTPAASGAAGGARGPALRACLGALFALSLVATAARADSTPTRRVYSIQDSPGYQRLFDPESMSVVLGRRLGAPRVHKPFQGGARSIDDLGRAVCRALHHNQRDSLEALCIRDDEFRDILWREFPQSRPAVGLQWDDAWTILYARLHAGCSHAVRDYGGHHYQFIRVEVDSTARYRNFTLSSGLTLVARDDEGQVQRMRWLRAVAGRDGRYKIYSTED